jgi:hypothetical protein
MKKRTIPVEPNEMPVIPEKPEIKPLADPVEPKVPEEVPENIPPEVLPEKPAEPEIITPPGK